MRMGCRMGLHMRRQDAISINAAQNHILKNPDAADRSIVSRKLPHNNRTCTQT